ncbi:MAG: DUF1080 domain-containing protein [Bacteroidota bacterium]
MKNIVLVVLFLITTIACKEQTSQSPAIDKEDTAAEGRYEGVFIDIQNNEIPANIDPDVIMETKQLPNMNLTNSEQFWGDKKDFVLFSMGSLNIPESGIYYFRMESTGKIQFKLDNKDLIVNTTIHDAEVNSGQMYLDRGAAILEYEYYPAGKDPKLVLEWSKDGNSFEVIPDANFENLDAFTVSNWEGDPTETQGDETQDNVLSEKEKEEGWQLLFDGETTNGWHTYNKPGALGRKWKAEDGSLVFEGRKRFEFYLAGRKIELGPTNKVLDGGEDIVSDDAFENFELKLDWWISEAGNNGIFYTVQEKETYDEIWKTSPEMQVMDNLKHKDGLINKHRAGDLYDLIPADPVRVKKQGEWNKVKIVKNKGKVEHWLNGTKVLAYDVNSPEWQDMISKSKFSTLQEFASAGAGKIGFQDHDNEVRFKNIKIKILE